MTDPAVEAARRAFGHLWPEQGDFEFLFDSSHREYAICAAREALRPVREELQRWDRSFEDVNDRTGRTVRRLLDALDPLIYAEDEL